MKWEAPSNMETKLIENYSNAFLNHDMKGERNRHFIIPRTHSFGTKTPMFVLNKNLTKYLESTASKQQLNPMSTP